MMQLGKDTGVLELDMIPCGQHTSVLRVGYGAVMRGYCFCTAEYNAGRRGHWCSGIEYKAILVF
jgi:hypothetical protein